MSFQATFDDGEGAAVSVSAAHDGEAGRRCGLKFNPGQHEGTRTVKGFCASAMQSIINQRDRIQAEHAKRAKEAEEAGEALDMREFAAFDDSMRGIKHALDLLEDAQMNGVKALYTRANAGLS